MNVEELKEKRTTLVNQRETILKKMKNLKIDKQLSTLNPDFLHSYCHRIVQDLISNYEEYCELFQSISELNQIIRENTFQIEMKGEMA